MMSINYMLAKAIQNDHLREANRDRLARLLSKRARKAAEKKAAR
jgi:hypothetical protein